MFCTCCGYKLEPETEFCPNCGAMVNNSGCDNWMNGNKCGKSGGYTENSENRNRWNQDVQIPPSFQLETMYSQSAPMSWQQAPGSALPKSKKRMGFLRKITSLFDSLGTRQNVESDIQSSKIYEEKKEATPVEFTTIAPKKLELGTYSTMKIFMYEEAYRYIVDGEKQELGITIQETRGGISEIPLGASVSVRLFSGEHVVFDEDSLTMEWNGKYLIFPFAVKLPIEFSEDRVCITAKVLIDGVLKITMKITPYVSAEFIQKIRMERMNIASAFMSYASQDRADVAMIVSAMEKVCPDMDIFFDVESIHSGEKWEAILYKEIQKRDVLFLCWSNHAKQSEWVEKEWKYALEQKGFEFIEPIPLQLPEECPPPEELKGKHFNDQRLYIRATCKK